jgi:ABC-type phosphate transport system auxiliary subunit
MKSTLAIYDAMLEAKIPAAAARGVAEALENDMEAVTPTKTDLQYLRTQMCGDTQALKTELQAEIKAVKSELQTELHAVKSEVQALKVEMDRRFEAVERRFDGTDDRFERLELRLTVKLGTFLAIAVGLIVTLQQVLR